MASMRRVWTTALVTLLALGLGLAVGWLWWPVEYYDTEIADLKKAHQADYVLMVSDAYALTGNLDAARERLGRLGVPDVAALVLSQVEATLAAGATAAEVGRLARLAAALGASSPTLAPYLTPVSHAP
jgi:hypothetical protein